MTSTTPLTPLHYDAPTVTLNVMGRAAAVSQWSDRPVVQVMRYELQLRSGTGASAAPTEIRGDRHSFLPLMQAVQNYAHSQLTGVKLERDRAADVPWLEPAGLLNHTLHLGTVQTSTGAAAVLLSTLQLADLTTVFDQLEQQIRPLPVTLGAIQKPRRSWRQWGTAAAGIVAAVGITTALWPDYQSQHTNEATTETPIADNAPAPALEEEIARSPEAQSSASQELEGEITAPAPATGDEPTAIDRPDGVDGATPATRTPPPAPATVSPEQSIPTPEPRAETAPPTTPTAPPAPAALPNTTSSEPAATDRLPGTAAPTEAPANDVGNSAPPESLIDATPTGSSAPGELEEAETAESFALPSAASQRTAPAPLAAEEAVPNGLATLIETVRDRWEPPASLTQPLIYTLSFAADGTLLEVLPEDELATTYRDETGIPPTGSIWEATGEPQQLRLRLQPTGEVDVEAALP